MIRYLDSANPKMPGALGQNLGLAESQLPARPAMELVQSSVIRNASDTTQIAAGLAISFLVQQGQTSLANFEEVSAGYSKEPWYWFAPFCIAVLPYSLSHLLFHRLVGVPLKDLTQAVKLDQGIRCIVL